jgi:hypothetical protein
MLPYDDTCGLIYCFFILMFTAEKNGVAAYNLLMQNHEASLTS